MNPLKWNDINTFLCSLLNFLQGFIVTLALIFIVIGAFMYITSAGDTGRVETAKKAIFGALIGLALGIAAPAFLKEIANLLGWAGIAACAGVGTNLTLVQIVGRILNFLLSIVGVASLIMLIVGAFMYLTAAGDEGRIDSGKSIVKYAIIGIIVALSALVLVRLVASFF
jgi:type II secretory pathway component PulF